MQIKDIVCEVVLWNIYLGSNSENTYEGLPENIENYFFAGKWADSADLSR